MCRCHWLLNSIKDTCKLVWNLEKICRVNEMMVRYKTSIAQFGNTCLKSLSSGHSNYGALHMLLQNLYGIMKCIEGKLLLRMVR